MAKKTKVDDKPETTPDGPVAVNDAWTGMLAVSLLALMAGAGFLFYDYYQYPSDIKPIPKLSGSPPQKPEPPQKQPPPEGGPKDGKNPPPPMPMPPMPKL
jgi:hypothetical protein